MYFTAAWQKMYSFVCHPDKEGSKTDALIKVNCMGFQDNLYTFDGFQSSFKMAYFHLIILFCYYKKY